MQKMCVLVLLAFLASCGLALCASSEDEVALTIYVHEGDLNGTMLSDVQIAGEDTAGTVFEAVTDSNGMAVVYGQPGTWQFSFAKDGYEPLDLSYDVEETENAAAYLEKSVSSEGEVALTIYVNEGDIDGDLLSGVQVFGVDAAGNEFAGVTDSSGSAVVYGLPGTWQFSFTKDGYEPLDLEYEVAETDAGAVYLVKA